MTHTRISRRDWTKGVVAASVSASLNLAAIAPAEAANPPSVHQENQRPGTRDWLLSRTHLDDSGPNRSRVIEGYCSQTSVAAGDLIHFHVSANPASPCTLEIFRLGYYGGAGGRLMTRLGPFDCQPQPEAAVGPWRLRDCQWAVAAELKIPADWQSGVYVGKLTELRNGHQSYLVFIVRDGRHADLIFQCSENTWQAYNRWPSDYSLYDDGNTSSYWGPNVAVSFNRPYAKYWQLIDQPLFTGSGEFFLWEFPFVYWLESKGYDVTYISNQDTHRSPDALCRARGFLSVGHDEYWTMDMFKNVTNAVRQGVNVGFFSGNSVMGKIQYDHEGRTFRRVGVFGPPDGHRELAGTPELPHERPFANELVGAHTTGHITGGADWICSAPHHWIYQQTGMRDGDAIPGLIGWEWHGDPAPIPGLEIVARGPTRVAADGPPVGEYTATVYPGLRDNFVFNASTCWWSAGLSAPPGYIRPGYYGAYPTGPDARVQQITTNVLHRMGAAPVKP